MADYNETETEMAKPDVNADGTGDSTATTEESRDVKEGGDSTLTIRFRDQTGEEVMLCIVAKCSYLFFGDRENWLNVNCPVCLTWMGF